MPLDASEAVAGDGAVVGIELYADVAAAGAPSHVIAAPRGAASGTQAR